MSLWTLGEIVDATGGTLVGGKRDQAISGVSIDTRSLEEGDLFVAIKGEVHDGHRFVGEAFEAGAVAAIVGKGRRVAGKGPLIRVDDTLRALEALGAAARTRTDARIIAVTGSVGKTGTKEALRLALSRDGATHASQKSYNNQWGVPLSLALMARETRFGVFEVGMNHPGEITPLTRLIRPHIAIITTVEPVHIGQFNSIEAIADAKAEVFDGLEPGGIAVLNRDNPQFARLVAAAEAAGAGSIVSFGADEKADARLIEARLHETCSCILADILGDRVTYKIAAPGRHFVSNSLAVLAAVKLAGADLALGALALSDWHALKGRGARRQIMLPGGPVTLIDESYNANPASMRAALEMLGNTRPGRGGRRIAVLGDMLELGSMGERLHLELAKTVADAGVDLVFACGPLMHRLWEQVPSLARGAYAATSAEIEQQLCAMIAPGDVIMIKGSLGSAMGPLVEAIARMGARAPAKETPEGEKG